MRSPGRASCSWPGSRTERRLSSTDHTWTDGPRNRSSVARLSSRLKRRASTCDRTGHVETCADFDIEHMGFEETQTEIYLHDGVPCVHLPGVHRPPSLADEKTEERRSSPAT